jgi:CBS domain-containing protein
MWWPAIGAVAVGAIGMIAPRTLGVGYSNIEEIISNSLPLAVVAWLCSMKLLSWLIALGSGTSGGTLAPLLTIGSGLGAVIAAGLNHLCPALQLPLGVAALVGMAAMFAGASRALLASVVFAFETTMQPHALPGLLIGATTAYLVSNLITRHSIMTEKISRRGVLVPSTYAPDPLLHVRVADVMASDHQAIPATMLIRDLAQAIAAHDPTVSRRHACLILTADERLAGIITRSDVVRAAHTGRMQDTVLQAGSRDVTVAYPDQTVREAMDLMTRERIGRLPVVSREERCKVLGYIGRGEILAVDQPDRREAGLLERMFPRSEVSAPAA